MKLTICRKNEITYPIYCVMTIAVALLSWHTQHVQLTTSMTFMMHAHNVRYAHVCVACIHYTLLQAFNTMLSTSQAQAEQVRAQLNGPPTVSETANSETASSSGNGHVSNGEAINRHATAAEETQYDDMKPLLATLQTQSQPQIAGLSPIQVSNGILINL
jgi:hypothetical protein